MLYIVLNVDEQVLFTFHCDSVCYKMPKLAIGLLVLWPYIGILERNSREDSIIGLDVLLMIFCNTNK